MKSYNFIHSSYYVHWSFAYVYIYILYIFIHMNYISCVGIYPYYIYHITFYSKSIRKGFQVEGLTQCTDQK